MNLEKYIDWVIAVFLTVCTIIFVFGAGIGVMFALGDASINWPWK